MREGSGGGRGGCVQKGFIKGDSTGRLNALLFHVTFCRNGAPFTVAKKQKCISPFLLPKK